MPAPTIDPQLEPESYPWYAVRVRPKCEKVSATLLRMKGLQEFLPLYRTRRCWSDRLKQLDVPLFSGYLFCRLNIASQMLSVLTTPGVVGLVSLGDKPVPIPEREVELVRAVISSGLPAMPWPTLCAGSTVLIEYGPLAGVEGVVLDAGKHSRLVISVPLLQRSVAVEIMREWIRPISGGRKEPAVPGGIALGSRLHAGEMHDSNLAG